MNFIPGIISMVLSVGFLMILFVIAWYIAIPVIMILLMLGLFNFFRGKPVFDQVNRFRRAMPNTSFRTSRPQTTVHSSSDKIIDVDYTELS